MWRLKKRFLAVETIRKMCTIIIIQDAVCSSEAIGGATACLREVQKVVFFPDC